MLQQQLGWYSLAVKRKIKPTNECIIAHIAIKLPFPWINYPLLRKTQVHMIVTWSLKGIVQFISKRSSPSSFSREFPSSFCKWQKFFFLVELIFISSSVSILTMQGHHFRQAKSLAQISFSQKAKRCRDTSYKRISKLLSTLDTVRQTDRNYPKFRQNPLLSLSFPFSPTSYNRAVEFSKGKD